MLRFLGLVTLVVINWRHMSSFAWIPPVSLPSLSLSRPKATKQQSTSALSAVKPNKNKKSKPAATTASGGAGFGTVPKASADVKVRAVSGFSGSGTKPLRQAANTFDQLLKDQAAVGTNGSNDTTKDNFISDVYVRSPLNDKTLFWFVGKVARCTIPANLKGGSLPTALDAVISQKRLILEYAKRELRPQNMGGPFEKGLELWLAPGNSEMDVVQNKVSLIKVEGSLATLADGFHVGDVGYNPEIYVGDEIQKGGLRVVRDENGHPIKPVFEVNEAK